MSYIYETYDYSLFESRFKDYNRLDQFSYAALKALFEYLEQQAEDLGEPLELDVIGLCCEWSEFDLEEALHQYDCENLDELERTCTLIIVDDNTVLIFN